MKYIVIGLGNFGSLVATRLTDMGHEVIGVDSNAARCDALRDNLSGILCLDSSSLDGLSSLPLLEVDVIIVAMGENFTASVQTVAQLRRLGARRIIARGLGPLHIGVLQTLGVERVVFPEKDGAETLAQSLSFSDFISSYRVDASHYIMQFVAPKQLVGLSIENTAMMRDYELQVITTKKVQTSRNILGLTHSERVVNSNIGQSTIIEAGDILVVYGTIKSYDALINSFR